MAARVDQEAASVVADMPADLAVAARLGGQMGRRFAEFDWASHPLGPPARWAPELRATVAVALTSRFPIVLWLGADDLYLVYNDAYLPMLGDKHPAALGATGRQVWWDIWPHIGPMLAGVVGTGQATWSDDLMLPLTTAGQPRERYFTFSYGPIVLADGRVDGVFCAVNETTDRVLAARRLHLLNAVAGAVMETRTVDQVAVALVNACGEHHPDLPFVAVYVADSDGHHSLGVATPSVQAVLPKRLAELISADSDDGPPASGLVGLESLMSASASPVAVQSRQALVLPLVATGQTAVAGHLVLGLNPHRPVDEQYRGFCRLLADQAAAALAAADSFQQQERRADMLAELDRAKTAFLTNVSHEFRTPLTLLLGPLQDAIDVTAGAGDDLQRARLVAARRNAQRLLRLVNSLLEFSRVEAGRAQLYRQPVNLGAVTAQIASSFAGLCERAGIDLVLDCAPAVVAVDVDMWETIVLNLLSNAVKFTYTGAITVRVTATDAGGARLAVSDTGAGIAAADLDRLFDRFYRASNTRGRTVEGSGIGLSLVRSLVELHDGAVAVTSALDAGTTVTVDLPPVNEHDDRAPLQRLDTVAADIDNAFVAEALQWLDRDDPVPAPATPAARDRAVILIADDNADMRAHLARILAPRWTTISASDGTAALRALRDHRPDLLITDVMMPGLDGFALVKTIREDPDLARTPVLMLSARAGTEAAGEGLASGADDYLVKPFTSAELVGRVDARLQAMAREQAHRADARQEAESISLVAALGSATSIPAILSALLSGPFGATAAALAVVDTDGRHLTVHYDGALPAEVIARYHRVALDAPIPVARVVATDQPIIVSDAGDVDPGNEQVSRDPGLEIRAGVIYPLHDSAATVIGALALLWPTPMSFRQPHLDLFGKAALTAGRSLARLRVVAEEHRFVTDFQEHLLGLDTTSTALAIAACYQPASEVMRVGGDWYLATPLGNGRISVCVGDVVGHGLPATTAMGNLRAVVAASALADPDPRHVLDNVGRYAPTVPGARCATLTYATLDTTTGTLDYMCAGHPHPLLVDAEGHTEFLQEGRLPPLAAFKQPGTPRAGQVMLTAGSMLILYTDGLIERRGQSIDEGFARLAAVAAAECATLSTDAACATLLRRLEPAGGYTDDVVILALRPTGTTATSWVVTVAADRGQIGALRQQLRDWLANLRPGRELTHSVLISVGEAVTNAIEHGSGFDTTKTVTIEAFATPERITVAVRDSGGWHGDSAASQRNLGRGRGLTLMHGLADRVDTRRGPRGTTVTLRYHRRAEPATSAPGAPS